MVYNVISLLEGGDRLKRKLADRAGEIYLCLMGSLFLLAVPFPGDAGGYSSITAPKFLLFASLSVPLLVCTLPALPTLRRGFRRAFCPEPGQLCALL